MEKNEDIGDARRGSILFDNEGMPSLNEPRTSATLTSHQKSANRASSSSPTMKQESTVLTRASPHIST